MLSLDHIKCHKLVFKSSPRPNKVYINDNELLEPDTDRGRGVLVLSISLGLLTLSSEFQKPASFRRHL